MRLLETLSELIQSEPQLERALKKVDPCKRQCEANGLPTALKQRLFKQVGEAALPLMREAYVWEGGEENLNFLDEPRVLQIIQRGRQSSKFNTILLEAGINEENCLSEIDIGTFSATANDGHIMIKQNDLDTQVISLSIELTNRIYLPVFNVLAKAVERGEISPEEYAENMITVEMREAMNKMIVQYELGIERKFNIQEVDDAFIQYKLSIKGMEDEEKLLEKLVANSRFAIDVASQKTAYENYLDQGKRLRSKYLSMHPR